MPEITIRHEIDTDEDTFWSKICFDEAFNKKMYEGSLGFPSWKVLESKDDDTKMTRKVRVEPKMGDMPGPMKKVVGDRLAYTEEGTFDKKAKKYTFKITPSAMPEKTKIQGELWVEKIADKKIRRTCRISVDVKVFMIGGMIEERILSDLKASYEASTTYTNKFIKENSL